MEHSLSPITTMSTSQEHHQQWPTMNRYAMKTLNHQQTPRKKLSKMMHQPQMTNISQITDSVDPMDQYSTVR